MPAITDLVGGELGSVIDRLRRATVRIGAGDAALGSGVVWSRDGTIVTNAHVARRSHAVVELWDGRRLEATLVLRDPRRDLALLRVAPDLLPEALVGGVGALRVGALVVAVGHPFGVRGAASVGIVHAVGDGPFVRSDVRLAPGNSGGPLATVDGRVVGINSMVVNGLGVAIGAHVVERAVREWSARAA